MFPITLILLTQFNVVNLNCIFSETHTDMYLEGVLLTVINTSSLFECAEECVSHPGCKAIGFLPENETCHLHGGSGDSEQAILLSRKQWMHVDIEKWTKDFEGKCDEKRCIVGERCIVPRKTTTGVCVEASIKMPLGFCPLHPKLSNAHVTPVRGEATTGIERTVICYEGYRDVTLDSANGTVSCQADGTWKGTIKCSGPFVFMILQKRPQYVFTPIKPDDLKKFTGGHFGISFYYKGCRDCLFSLKLKQGKTGYDLNTFEIAIGGYGNSKTFIKKPGSPKFLTKHLEKGVVSCKDFRPFWLSWGNGYVAVGKGTEFRSKTLTKVRHSLMVKDVVLSISSHIDNVGVWLFHVQPDRQNRSFN